MSWKKHAGLLLFVVGTLVRCGVAAPRPFIPESRWQSVIDDVAKRHRFEGAIAIQHHGKIVAKGGYRIANHETKESNTPKTHFRMGSVSKQFAAVAVLQLKEKGLVDLESPIGKYLTDWPSPIRDITVHQVLSHTSGIKDYKYLTDDPYSAVAIGELVKLFKDLPLDFEPGSRWKYSNTNYVVAGYLVERVTGKSYENYVMQTLFPRAGMPTSGYAYPKQALTGFSQGYHGGRPVRYADSSFAYAAGALYSTVEDMCAWTHALATKQLINAESLKRMGTIVGGEYGYGVWIRTVGGHRSLWHGGYIPGWLSALRVFVDEDLGIAVETNHDDTISSEAVEKEIAEALVE